MTKRAVVRRQEGSKAWGVYGPIGGVWGTTGRLLEGGFFHRDAAVRAAQVFEAEWAKEDAKCGECGGRGLLHRLGGDWGKTPESEVTCWACKGTGRRS